MLMECWKNPLHSNILKTIAINKCAGTNNQTIKTTDKDVYGMGAYSLNRRSKAYMKALSNIT